MTYCFSYKIDARCDIEIEADSLEEAKEKALDAICDVDFGEATDIDTELVSIEDNNGKILYEE